MIIRSLLAVLSLAGFWMLFRLPDLSRLRIRKAHADLLNVSVIIPARNEENRIRPLIRSLQTQNIQFGEIIIINDHSEDNTAALAEKAGFTVVHSTPLPNGWQGKSWACWQGAQLARGPNLLFLDADTILEDQGAAKIYAEFRKQETPLSIQPYHTIEQPYENLSAYFNIVSMMGTSSFTPLGVKILPKAFFGPCQMIRKSDYLQVGGHNQVHDSVLDDVALGQLFVTAGIPIRNLAGRGAIRFRMYPQGIRDVIEGWSKNFALGSQSIGFPSLLLISLWIYASFNVALSSVRMAISPSFPFATSLLLLYILFSSQLWWMLRRIGNFSFFTAVFFPIPLFFFTWVFVRGIVL